jgi:acetyl esterase/lipase
LAIVALGLSAGAGASPAKAATGGVNTGNPGSTCAPTSGGQRAAPLEAGMNNTSLGRAPAYYETGGPTGAYAGKSAKGIVLTVHGGGWFTVGAGAVTAERPVADDWRANGWRVVNLTYPACNGPGELATLRWFYDTAARIAGHLPVGAEGDSAGGNLVLMLATERPLSFVISRGGPTDLATLATEPSYDPATGHHTQYVGSQAGYNWAVAAFGKGGLAAMSPALAQSAITGRVLQASAWTDPLVSLAQYQELHVGTMDILSGPGPVPWVHGSVTVASAWGFVSARAQLLTGLA